MRSPLFAAFAVVLTVSACATVRESRFNPFNWFGRSQETRMVAADDGRLADGRQLVAEVVELKVEPMPGGAIVRATGRNDTQGWWNGELVEQVSDDADSDPSIVTFQFVVAQPWDQTRVSTPRSRELTVGTFLTKRRLETIRAITVIGARNSRTSRR